MKVIILVGGEGTRLRPLTYSTPKAMMPVLNIPFIHHVINHLNRHDINHIILSMGYKPDAIKKYFDVSSGTTSRIIYNIEDKPLGTAGAVKYAQKYLDKQEQFFVMNGDVFTDMDLTGMLNFHRSKKAAATIALTAVADPTQFGVVEIDSQYRIKRFVEKPKREEAPSNLINAGFYILEPKILKNIPEDKFTMFERDVFPQLIAAGEPVYGYVTDSYWIDMGTPHKYLRLSCDLLQGKCTSIKPHDEDIIISKNSIIDVESELQGPLLIDANCRIGKGVILKGPTVIGMNCEIAEDSKIEGSILWSSVSIGRNVKMKNCIIASNNFIEDNANLENEVINKGS
jgi:mannose-1-phosphate guanylyltransferase